MCAWLASSICRPCQVLILYLVLSQEQQAYGLVNDDGIGLGHLYIVGHLIIVRSDKSLVLSRHLGGLRIFCVLTESILMWHQGEF